MVDNPKARETRRPHDRFLLLASLAAFALWLISIGPVRRWVTEADARFQSVVGVAPSFFAGITWTFWQAFVTRTGPFTSAAYAVALVVLAEAVQLFLPHYTADLWDIAAGTLGAAIAVPILYWRREKVV